MAPDLTKYYLKLNNRLLVETEYSALVDDIHAGETLVIAFGFYNFTDTPAFDFYGRLKKLQRATGEKLNLILLRDKTNLWYQNGIDGLGADVDETIASLKNIIANIKPGKIITIGQSMGAYAAIEYGALLGADRAIAFGPLSFLDVKMADAVKDHRWYPVMQELEKKQPKNLVHDLAQFLKVQKKLPEINIIYGSMEEDADSVNLDNYHAKRLEMNGVKLVDFPESPHAVVKYLIDNKRIDNILGKLIFDMDISEMLANYQGDEEEGYMAEKKLSYEWAKWILENLMLGVDKDIVKNVFMESAGVTAAEAEADVYALAESPALEMCRAMAEDTKKREWLQTTIDSLSRKKEKYLKHFINDKLPDYKTFLNDYYYENKPGLFHGAISDWPAMNWTPEGLKKLVNNPEIEVQSGRSKDARYEQNGDKYKTKMKFNDFIDKVLNLESSNDMYLTANNSGVSSTALGPLFKDLKNLGDGFMDMQKLAQQGFIWIGPKGTVTPTHHDLTNNLFFQIYGRKRFWLVPSCQTPYIYNGQHVYSDVDIRNPDYDRYPEMRKATVMQFDVGPGDFLFIPIGWWHAVESLSVSISFSSNAFANQPNDYFLNYPQGYNRY